MNKLKIVSLAIVMVGIVVIAGGIVGWATVELERDQYRIYSNSGTSSSFTDKQILDPDHYYEIIITIEAEYTYDSNYGSYAYVDGTAMIYINEVLELNDILHDSEYRDEDSTGVDAIDSAYYSFTPTVSTNVTIVGTMTQGDEWSIVIYRDVPPELNDRAAVQLILVIAGFVIFVIGLGLFAKVRNST